MRPPSEVLGVMYPVGGGDPIPLTKAEIVIGRRPGNDIRLDFENISGKHCKLRFANGLWMVRDLGSTNGTTVNGSLLASEQSVMPDEELGIAGHLFTIDYEPAGPEAFLEFPQRTRRRCRDRAAASLAHGSRGARHGSVSAETPEERPASDRTRSRPTRANSMTRFPSTSRRPQNRRNHRPTTTFSSSLKMT